MDSWIKFKIEEIDLEELRYNSKKHETIIMFKNGDKIIVTGSKARKYFAKIENIRRDI